MLVSACRVPQEPLSVIICRGAGTQPPPGWVVSSPHLATPHHLSTLTAAPQWWDPRQGVNIYSFELCSALHALLTSIWLYPDVFLNNERDATHHDPAAARGVSISSSCRSGVQSREYREYLQSIYTPSLLRSLFLPELWETNPAVIISIHGADHLIHLQQTNK